MRFKKSALLVFLFLAGCESYNEFANYRGTDSASVTVSRKSGDQYQTGIRIVSESQLKLEKIDSLTCYVESKNYWRHAESLGHWNDKPDIFETTLTVSTEKQYLLVKNWVLGMSCGGVFEFIPEVGGEYILEISGLMPNCLMQLRNKDNSKQNKLIVKNVPECK